MIPTFVLLALAVAALWGGGGVGAGAGRNRLWIALCVAALAAGLIQGVVELPAVAWAAALALAVFIVNRTHSTPRQRGLAAVAVAGLAAGLMLHALPGFHNPRVIAAARFTPDAVPFSLYLNFDKTLIALCVLGWGCARITTWREWRAMLAIAAPRAAVTIAAVLALSLAAGFVRWAPKLPAETALWAGVNLLFVCPAEEALFRGFVQAQLQRAWSGVRGGAWWALAAGAVLFGAAHAAGGMTYVALATVAGAGYGWVYLRTGRIEASILTHFALNAAHFLLFTYPALAR